MMRTLSIIANFSAYSIGLIGLIILLLRYLISRDRRILGFLLLYIPLTIIIFSTTLDFFFSAPFFNVLSQFSMILVTIGAPYFCHATFQSSESVFLRIKWFGSIYILLGLMAYFFLPTYDFFFLLGMAVSTGYSTLLPLFVVFGKKALKKDINKEDKTYNNLALLTAGFSALGAPFLFYFNSGQGSLPIEIYDPFYYLFIILPILSYQSYLLIHKKVRENSIVDAGLYNFSDREYEVVLKLIQGKSYKEIGQELFISLATVKTHTNRIYRKTSMKNKSELMNLFR